MNIETLIANTQATIPGYLEKTLAQRLDGGAGSRIVGYDSVEEVLAAMKRAKWEKVTHPDVQEGCQIYHTSDITGTLGLAYLEDLDPAALVTFDDRKGTGKVSITVEGQQGPHQLFTSMIVGKEQGVDVIFTLHPGDPIRPSVTDSAGLHGKQITVAEAYELGFRTAKII